MLFSCFLGFQLQSKLSSYKVSLSWLLPVTCFKRNTREQSLGLSLAPLGSPSCWYTAIARAFPRAEPGALWRGRVTFLSSSEKQLWAGEVTSSFLYILGSFHTGPMQRRAVARGPPVLGSCGRQCQGSVSSTQERDCHLSAAGKKRQL